MGKSVTLIGLGNIGSALARQLARMTDLVGALVLVDHDVYDESNLSGQQITPEDIGKPKVVATAERLRQVNPDLRLTPLPHRAETAPLGALRSDVIIACVDSRRSRSFINEIATRLGRPWIDTGIAPEARLTRTTVYAPGPAAPCYSCNLDDIDYARMDQLLTCTGLADPDRAGPPPTRAPAWLGTLCASLAAAQCELLLTGREDESLIGRELVTSVPSYLSIVTPLGPKSSACRFDHQSLNGVEQLSASPDQLTLGNLPGLSRDHRSTRGVQLRVEGHHFVNQLTCVGCGDTADVLFLSGRLPRARCRRCGEPRVPLALSTLPQLDLSALPDRVLRRSVRRIGMLGHDIFSLRSGVHESHFELGG